MVTLSNWLPEIRCVKKNSSRLFFLNVKRLINDDYVDDLCNGEKKNRTKDLFKFKNLEFKQELAMQRNNVIRINDNNK